MHVFAAQVSPKTNVYLHGNVDLTLSICITIHYCKNTTNFNSIWNHWTNSHSTDVPRQIPIYLFICLFLCLSISISPLVSSYFWNLIRLRFWRLEFVFTLFFCLKKSIVFFTPRLGNLIFCLFIAVNIIKNILKFQVDIRSYNMPQRMIFHWVMLDCVIFWYHGVLV